MKGRVNIKFINLLLHSQFWTFLVSVVKSVARFIKLVIVKTDDDPSNDNIESEE